MKKTIKIVFLIVFFVTSVLFLLMKMNQKIYKTEVKDYYYIIPNAFNGDVDEGGTESSEIETKLIVKEVEEWQEGEINLNSTVGEIHNKGNESRIYKVFVHGYGGTPKVLHVKEKKGVLHVYVKIEGKGGGAILKTSLIEVHAPKKINDIKVEVLGEE